MSKPIFIVTVPHSSDELTIQRIADELTAKMSDYHVLMIRPEIETEEIQFKVFYEKDFDQVKFEELKEYVRSEISGHSLNRLTGGVKDNHKGHLKC